MFTAGAAICATLAAICAVGYFFTAYQANEKSQALNATVKKESLLKDEQWQKDKQESDRLMAEAQERTQGLELRVAKQQERAARAEKELLAFKDNIFTDRVFAWDEARKILNNSPKASARVSFAEGDREASLLASRLIDLLVKCGWTTSGPESGRAKLPFVGIRLEVSGSSVNEKDLPSHVFFLQKALTAGLKNSLHSTVDIVPNPDLPKGSLTIFVGNRIWKKIV
jgi:hypothetical protein